MHRTHLLASLTLTLCISACATSTPYQPAEHRRAVGYTETQLTDNRYRIVFAGNHLTPRQHVHDYALLRAAELTLQAGYEWFQLAGRDEDRDVRTHTRFGTGWDSGPRTAVYQRCGLLTCNTVVTSAPAYHSGLAIETAQAHTAYTTQLEIVLGKGPIPTGPDTYPAQPLAASLRRALNVSSDL